MSAPREGTVAVVTGGGRGLGYAIVEHLGRQGADVVLVDLLEEVTESAARLSAQLASTITAEQCDVTDPVQVLEVFERLGGARAPANVLVDAAGIAWNEPALTVSAERWRTVLDVTVTGTFLPCQAFARQLVAEEQPGAIVTIACTSGQVVDLPHRIRIDAIAPGYLASDMTKAVSVSDPAVVDEWMRRTPAGRMGRPDELGPLVSYLCGDHAEFVVVQTITVDGGYSIV